MQIIVNALIGRGINGVKEVIITVDENTEVPVLQQLCDETRYPYIDVEGEIKNGDSYFNAHPLSGKHRWVINRAHIVAIID
jgi:hypothetical protein